jgi:hypothetical protein
LLVIVAVFPEAARSVYIRADLLAFSRALAGINPRLAAPLPYGRPIEL